MNDSAVVGTGGLRELGRAYLRRRYGFLFYTLLLTIAAAPVVTAFELQGSLMEFFLAANLLAAVMPVGAGRDRRILLTIITVVWLARPATEWFDHPALSAMTLGMWTLIGLVAAAAALRFAMRATVVDAEHLYAALGAYLLAGLFFGMAYWGLQQASPEALAGARAGSLSDAIYFSFVTLATLGYGDIVPRGEIARGLAVVEGIGGQLFLAVMVARLVSLYVRKD